MIGILDFKFGNIKSYINIFERLSIECDVISNPKEISKYKKLILPGMGHFGNGIEKIKKNHFFNPLIDILHDDKTYILGICVGMQFFFEGSEEGDSEGFGIFKGKVKKFKIPDEKLPNIGWRKIKNINQDQIINKDLQNDIFYFSHSYHVCDCEEEMVTSESHYEYPFVSSISKNKVYGIQFHPEKSHIQGINIIKKFYLLK